MHTDEIDRYLLRWLRQTGRASTPLLALLLVSLWGAEAQAALQVINPTGGTNASNGLRISLLDSTQMQVRRVNQNQLFDPAQNPANGNSPNSRLDNGVYLAIGTTLYGPNHSVGSPGATPQSTNWNMVSMSAVAGDGSVATPWTVVTVVSGGGATVRVTTSYIAGQDNFTESVQVTPPAGNTQQIRYYHLIDTYLQGSDSGPGYVLPATGVPTIVGTFQGVTVYEEFISGSRPWNDWYSALYSTMFQRVRNGGSLGMTVNTNSVDNGIGVQWNLGAITSAQSWDYRISFRPTPRCVNNTICSNPTPACNTATGDCVAASVTLTNPPAGGTATTTNRTPAITGTGVPGQTVTVTRTGGVAVCTATVSVAGTWTCTPAAQLPIGSTTITATSTGATSSGTLVIQCSSNAQCGGVLVCSSGSCVPTACFGSYLQGTALDCAATTPVCTNPATASAVCGACPSSQVYNTSTRVCVSPSVTLQVPPAGGSSTTTNQRQTISGTGIPGQTVTVSEAGTTICSGTVSMAGTWNCTPGSNLSIGAHPLVATSGGASSSGTLVVQCTMNNQCGMGQVCSGGACTTPSCTGNSGAGTARDCPIGTPICQNPGMASAMCVACGSGLVYNTNTRTCVMPSLALTQPPAGGSQTTTNTMLSVNGTGTPGQTVTVTDGGATVCTATVQMNSSWTCTPGTAWSIGSHPLTATSAGRTSTGTLVVQCTMNAQCGGVQVCSSGSCVTPVCTGNSGSGTAIDCPSATPQCTNPGTATASCGTCGTGRVFNPVTHLCVAASVVLTTPPAGSTLQTTNQMQPIAGTGIPAQTVTVSEGGTVLCSATVDNSGTWTCTPTSNLSIGTHNIVATSGGASSAGTLLVRCTLDNQCSMGQVCGAGICVTPSCSGNNGSGSTADCPAATPLCMNPGTATAACVTCATGEVFNTTTHTCVPLVVMLTNPPAGGTAMTMSQMPSITGTGVAGQSVDVSEAGSVLCTATVNAMNQWSCTPMSNLSIGSHMLVASSGAATSMGTLVVQCSMNSQCTGTQVCNTMNGTCIMPVCTGNSGATTAVPCPMATPVCQMPSTASSMCVACPMGQFYDTMMTVCRGCTIATQGADCSGNTSACDPATGRCVMPMVAVTTPANGSSTANGQPTIVGTSSPLQTVTVTIDGMNAGTVIADSMGNWTFMPTTPLMQGMHNVSASIVTGATTTNSNTNQFNVVGCLMNSDCRAPLFVCDTTTRTCRGCTVATQAADCSAPTSACSSATNQCVMPAVAVTAPMEGATTGRRPTVTGTATPGQTVTVLIDMMAVGTAVADAMGNWSLVLMSDLSVGMHTAQGRITIAGANTDSTANRFSVAGCMTNADCMNPTPICDTTMRTCRPCNPATASDCPTTAAPFCSMMGPTSGSCVAQPPAVLTPANGSTTTSSQPTITGTGPANATIQVFIDGMNVGQTMSDAMGSWTFMPTMSLTTGMHRVSASNVTGGVVGPQGNANTFTIGGCTTNADCMGATPVCNTATMTCRPCNPMTEAMDCNSPARPVCATSGANMGMCVARAPTVTLPADGAMIASRRPDVVGVATPGSTVAIFIDGMEVGRAMVDAMGNFRLMTPSDLSLGMHTVAAATVDTSGTAGARGPMNTFTIIACRNNMDCSGGTPICDTTTMNCRPCNPMMASDCTGATPVCSTTAPTAGRCVTRPPTITTPANGSTTTSRRPNVTGTAQAGTTVAILIDGMEVGRAMVDAMGNFTFMLPRDLTPGMHTIAAAPVDGMGTTGTAGPSNTFTIPECMMDSECGMMLMCDTTMGRCVPRTGDGGMNTDASSDGATDGATSDGSTEDAGMDASMNDGATNDGFTGDGGGVVREGGMNGDGSVVSEGGLHVTGAGACTCRVPGAPSEHSEGNGTLALLGMSALCAVLHRRRVGRKNEVRA